MEKVSVFTSLTSMVDHGWSVRIAAQGTWSYSATATNSSLRPKGSASATGATVSIALSNLHDKVMEREGEE